MIRLENVSKRYWMGDAQVVALEDVSLEVAKGEFIVVLGPSGSGKTTLLNIIGALDLPTDGQIIVNGGSLSLSQRADRFKFRRKTVSFIFQTFNLFPSLTAQENVQFVLDMANEPHAQQKAAQVLADVGLGDRVNHFPHQLSGGEQQRVAIARALATGNPVLLADEPTGELDFRTGIQILDLLQQQAAAGKTVLVVTHNREISRIADRVIELSCGRIVSDGAPRIGKATLSELQW
ncbi:ABC transporter ATP-binding protein [Aggregatilinea lenta]|uniref:ABC transporter ATP-binding protein n=1 Tax=Aggregatilinea lenta TaxID=913108 RepID=UPI000E5B5C2B|nr:ABC transporter ATP-binding protein [Aggregatilinea lenta]